MEPVTFAIGGAVAKWAFKLWAGDGAAVDLTADLAGIVGQKITEPFQRRSVTRQFESLADEIARRLEPYLASEITGLDDAERQAVCLAAQETINSSLLNVSSILSLDLDPVLIRRHMLKNDPDAKRRYGLSEAGESMYDTLITEVAGYVSISASTLPGFSSQQTAELLSRDSQIIGMLVEVLDKMPKSAAPSKWGNDSNDLLFENDYRKSVFRHSDKLQLFGVSSRLERSSYSLSVAYISMSVASDRAKDREFPDDTTDSKDVNWKRDGSDYVSVEEALSAHPYVMVSGGAGSGKTTLIQWLAASAARSSFSGSLESWNGRVPFILPLRRFVDVPLPRPEDFVAPIAEPIAGAMPVGWVHRILTSGRGLVLVDGLDEIPAGQRVETTSWLEKLIDYFPDNRFIITSRSTALSEDLMKSTRFAYANLLPMEYPDIKQFVAHWHAAAIRDVSSVEEKDSIRESERLILSTIRDRSSIKSLCSSPLLCALICALNRDRAGNIPENRMELYDTALQMLVVRRDEARRVSVVKDVALSYKESEVLLRSFALWLHENGHADAEKGEFESRIGKELAYLHRMSASKEDVAQHLLVRSGVLREPVPGRVDFVHRTFLEYLAAAAIVDDDSITKLVLHAHEDYWREVVIMAAGHAKLKDREELIRGLIARGRDEPELTHRLYLLAVACMETSTDLSPSLQKELRECLERVIPPRNMTDAAAVASAGPIAVPLLAGFQGYAVEAAACVRALVLIGGDAALRALEHFGGDARVTVARELIRGWSYFDAEAYAGRVLAKSPLDNGLLRVRDAEYLRYVDLIPAVKSLVVESTASPADFVDFPGSDAVVSFALSSASQFLDLAALSKYRKTFSVSLRNCRTLVSLNGVEAMPEAAYLDFEGCSNLTDITALKALTDVQMIDLSGTSISSLDPVLEFPSLQMLYIHDCKDLVDLGESIPSTQVVFGDCPSIRDYSAFSRSSKVRKLDLRAYSGPLPGFELPPNLLQLAVIGRGVPGLVGAPELEEAHFRMQDEISIFVRFLADHPKVSRAMFSAYGPSLDVSSLADLESHPSLQVLTIFSDLDSGQPIPELKGFSANRNGMRILYRRDAA
jgi:hypothetical protein